MATDIDYMKAAIAEAECALNEGEVPVGAVLVIDGSIISRAHNKKETSFDPTAHAEMLTLRDAASSLSNWRLSHATLYVTKEPCIMCAGAMINARIQRLVFGCTDNKGGAVSSLYRILSDDRLNHQVEVVSGVLEEESRLLLKRFFGELRTAKTKYDITQIERFF